MKRLSSIWLLLLLCALVIFGAMGWMTQRVLESENERVEAQSEARVSERVGLALSRMDTIGAALLVVENQRPPLHYEAFFSPEDVFTSRLGNWEYSDKVVRASPLLSESNELIRLHFEMREDGVLRSPEVPPLDKLSLLDEEVLSEEQLSRNRVVFAELEKLLGSEQQGSRQKFTGACVSSLAWNEPSISALDWGNRVVTSNGFQGPNTNDDQVEYANALNTTEQSKRSDLVKKEVSRTMQKQKVMPTPQVADERVLNGTRDELASLTPFQPVWVEGELFLVRFVQGSLSNRYQGIWLDHEKLRSDLIEQLPEGLDHCRLLPALNRDDDPFSLVSLPWRIEVGAVPAATLSWNSPIYWTLGVGWLAAVAAIVAIGFLLAGVVRLSERRAAFVSSVTHELRTPLTTFRLYSEMLAEGMVTDEGKKQEYLRTMMSESERLNHLVENVLSYSQIERGNARAQKEKLGIEDLVERIRPVLQRRVDQENAALSIRLTEELGEVETDVTAVEQILFNLVDNACKYGLPESGQGHVSLNVWKERGGLVFEISDNGVGVDEREKKRLFMAFHKSAQEAAHSKPGVGLGLALCKRLARALGGDLRLARPRTGGACFQLTLPEAG
ncbi:MAG: sensor histidine kinase [Verrucomicrobiaceae bacterium]